MRDESSADALEPSSLVLEVFFQFLQRRTGGEHCDFEAFCSEHPEIADELRRAMSAWERSAHSLSVTPPASRSSQPPSSTADLLARLRTRGIGTERYEQRGEIARGGMGSISLVWDRDLRRTIAMKSTLSGPTRADANSPSSKWLHRFLEEAQITGQLDHPGIVPVHELGLDERESLYFTMRLVQGDDLVRVFENSWKGEAGWNQTRVVGVLLKVCEAMAYAHSKGVIHRDLKPANVMIGPFGEVYVMDWGLARARGRPDLHDLRLRDAHAGAESVHTERRAAVEGDPDSSLVTMDGDVLGTPAYMPPEQAHGRIDELSPRSDVYAVGAMLYHLLARERPYDERRQRGSVFETLMRVRSGPPRPIVEARPDATPELVAICERAMERDPDRRYPGMLELAEDLRAYLEGRVVHAYETGLAAEARKWVKRNRGLASAAAAAVLAALLGTATTIYVQAVGRRAAERESSTRKEVLDLFIGMFADAKPINSRKADITVREVLERSAAEIPHKLADDPLGRALLMHEMARVYKSIELPDAARTLLEETLAVRRKELGDEHVDTQAAMVGLAHLHLNGEHPELALPLLREILAIRRRTLGDDDPETWNAIGNLAAACERTGDDAGAEKLNREILALQLRRLGVEAPRTIVTLNNLAVFLQRRGRAAEAFELLSPVVGPLILADRLDSEQVLLAAETLAVVEFQVGHGADSTAHLRRVLEARTRRKSADDPSALATASRLAKQLAAQGERAEAEKLMRATLAARQRVLGNLSATRESMADLADLLLQRGARDEAAELAHELLDLAPTDDPGLARYRELQSRLASPGGTHDETR